MTKMTTIPASHGTSFYLSAEDLMEMLDPKDGSFECTVKGMTKEMIQGVPKLVLHIEEDPRGIIVTRKLYEDLTRVLGPSPTADEFFQRYGLQ